MREFRIRPIGVIRSPLKYPEDAPKQGALTGQEAEVVVDPAYLPALEGLKIRLVPWEQSEREADRRRSARNPPLADVFNN